MVAAVNEPEYDETDDYVDLAREHIAAERERAVCRETTERENARIRAAQPDYRWQDAREH